MMRAENQSSAFSLVELSIVLVILGLLTGGILAGQSLIHAAELRSVSTDFQTYVTAIRSFRDKYFAIPGDMTNATSFWGSIGGTGANNACFAGAAVGGTATCNGNGNGNLVDYLSSGGIGSYENSQFWHQLSNAGLVKGYIAHRSWFSYSAGYEAVPGVDVPASKFGNGAYFFAMDYPSYAPTGDTRAFAADPNRNLMFTNGTIYTVSDAISAPTGTLVITPEDAWNIDTKMDDGRPGSGKMIAFKGSQLSAGTIHNCTTTAEQPVSADGGSQYNLSLTTKDCVLYFPNAF